MKRGKKNGQWKCSIKVTAAVAAGLAVAILLAASLADPRWMMQARFTSEELSANTIVIDAGHGGFDGGAVSKKGTAEKDINLAIALQLQELAEQDGWQVIMTRTEDVALDEGDDERKRIRTRKSEDLRNRKALIDEAEPLLAISIHLNSFQEDPSVRGAQTFYPSKASEEQIVEESKRLAESIQEALVSGLQDGTDRQALEKKDVLLLKDPTVPTVIVECGFLSNAADESNLKDPEHQRKLSEFIYEGILEFSGKTRDETLFVVDSCAP